MSPGTNAGTGQPLSFRCAACRRGARSSRHGRVDRVLLLGPTKTTILAGVRMVRIARQYKCMDCGHVGWSRHADLARLADEHA